MYDGWLYLDTKRCWVGLSMKTLVASAGVLQVRAQAPRPAHKTVSSGLGLHIRQSNSGHKTIKFWPWPELEFCT